MIREKANRESATAIRAALKKEMAKPRMARSARIAERNLDTSLMDENGEDGKLKKGSRVDVAVATSSKARC